MASSFEERPRFCPATKVRALAPRFARGTTACSRFWQMFRRLLGRAFCRLLAYARRGVKLAAVNSRLRFGERALRGRARHYRLQSTSRASGKSFVDTLVPSEFLSLPYG